jgi:hypothetical protein
MSALSRPRQSLDVAEATFKRTASLTANHWNDDARRSFDARISEPLEAALRQYTATLTSLDSTLDGCLRLISG